MTRRRDDDEDDLETTRAVDLSRGLVSMRPETIFKALWTMGGIVIAATVGVTAQLYAIHSEIAEVSRKVDGRTSDRWTLSMEREMINNLQRDNPTIKMPDPDAIHARITPWESSK